MQLQISSLDSDFASSFRHREGEQSSDESFELQTLIQMCCNVSDSKLPRAMGHVYAGMETQFCYDKVRYTKQAS